MSYISLFLVASFLTWSVVLGAPSEEPIGQDVGSTDLQQETNREGKIFPLVKVVRFANTPCVSSSGLVGTCYSDKECTSFGGEESGRCANGVGACCVFKATSCDSVIDRNNSYFQNPGFPSKFSSGGMCMVEAWLPKGTVQVKLTFLSFDIVKPVEGDCDNDTFVITGVNPGVKIPILCGFNSGQHLFFDVDNSQGVIKLIFSLSGLPFDRTWNIQVSFLTDYDPCKAPPRCLQYFTDITGSVSSFNYATKHEPMLINELHYSICFAYIPNYCDIGFTFSNLDMGVLDNNLCPEDYLAIQGTSLCGTSTGVTVQANATGPIIVFVKTDGDNSALQQGFRFSYTYLPC